MVSQISCVVINCLKQFVVRVSQDDLLFRIRCELSTGQGSLRAGRPFQIPIDFKLRHPQPGRCGCRTPSSSISNSHWLHSSRMQSSICLLSSEPRAAWYLPPTAPRLAACTLRLAPLNSLMPTQHFDSSHFCSGFTSCMPRC